MAKYQDFRVQYAQMYIGLLFNAARLSYFTFIQFASWTVAEIHFYMYLMYISTGLWSKNMNSFFYKNNKDW